MTDTNKERAAFEARYASQPDVTDEPERSYELDEAGINELIKDCIWEGWKARAAKAPAAPTGWYALSADGMATLCVDRDDAEKTAADSEKKWPNCGPYRAVQLYTAPPAPTEQQIGALQAELAGNEAATMHLSRMVDELRALLCQAMRVMKDLHESATPDESREDCPPIIPTSDFAKFVNDNAALMYAIKQCGHDPAPPQGAAKGDGNG